MRLSGVCTVTIAFMMVFSGLVLLTGGIETDDTQPIGSGPDSGNEPLSFPDTGVLRTVFVEEFTHALCTYCVPTEEQLAKVVASYGYDKIAPLCPHIQTSIDDVFFYNPSENTERNMYYRNFYQGAFSYVPWCAYDGRNLRHDYQKPDAFEEYLHQGMGKMARFSITTTGDVGAGTVSAIVEAHDFIEADPDRVIRFALWEDQINVSDRWGAVYHDSQKFDYYDWAVWNYLPDTVGEQVFPAGAVPGQTVQFDRIFTLEPEWNMSEMGVTVWIQDDTTRLVEQASVEDFKPDPPIPTHDLAAYGLTVDDNPLYYKMGPDNNIRANKLVYVNSTVLNYGSSVENNIQINLLVNSIVEDTLMITTLDPGWGQTVSLMWDVPTIEGAYDVGIEAVVVAGEMNTTNNLMERDCTVVQLPGILSSPDSFHLDVSEGMMTYDNISVLSDDLIDLDFEVDIGNYHEIMGEGDFEFFHYNSNGAGNKYYVDKTTQLKEFRQFLTVDTDTDRIYYLVYERNDSIEWGRYFKIFELNDTNPQAGVGWYSSGPIDLTLVAGNYYYIGVYFVGDPPGNSCVTIYWDDALLLPYQTSFGELQQGYKWYFAGDYTPDDNGTHYAGGVGPFLQSIISTDNSGNWLSVAPDNGSLSGGSGTDVLLTADATSLTEGTYYTNISIWNNDPDSYVINIPVDLTVHSVPSAPFDIPVLPGPTGWEFISFPLSGVSGDVSVILDDTLNGDSGTTWDQVQWFDAQTQEWKSYATFKPAILNNMPDIDNTMGVWVHITANSGDGEITTGLEGFYPSITKNIDLFTGWNLVGYPSATSRLASDTLPVQADMVAVYDSGQPYSITDETVLTGVTMQEGNAYWVHVTADCTWGVDP